MVIRLINEQDDRFSISHVYEESWKSAYRGMLPQEYLDGIPKGRWAPFLNDSTYNTTTVQISISHNAKS